MNNISLEGVSFNTAVKIIQNCPDEVELIISQPKGTKANASAGSGMLIVNSGHIFIRDAVLCSCP